MRENLFSGRIGDAHMLMIALSMTMILTLATATAIALKEERDDASIKVLAKKQDGFGFRSTTRR
ncbi:hypothetical protein [Jiella mangrovi]|nr:hypothetical protein [Jiella mangrovi]